ncbi:siderophore ABC transporter substrate-binding protein [Cardiobacteriaceae bacterium TAE3-ERU3]|nr:siderophore ABC transporter substrate-binding protein [Cardiobacteriaceae bacterium TAE3-ERU3]
MKKTILAALCALTLPVSAFAVDIESARGTIDAPENPQKVVTYDIGVLDTLDALGVEVAGVPNKLFVDYLEKGDAEEVGTLFEPNIEALAALQPDWVVVAGRSAKQYDAVGQVAPTADLTIASEDLYNQALTRLDDLGKVFGKEDEAAAIKERLNGLRDAVKAKTEGTGKALMLLVSGPKISLYGPDSRGGWLEKDLGFDLVEAERAPNVHGGSEGISFEYIAEENPDWLIVIDRAAAIGKDDLENAKSVLDNEVVAQTNAWKNGNVIYLNPADIYIAVGGVQAMENIMKQLDEELPAK